MEYINSFFNNGLFTLFVTKKDCKNNFTLYLDLALYLENEF